MEVAMNIDKQRVDAVRMLQALGYTYRDGERLFTYRGGERLAPAGAAATPLSLMAKADAMHGALMRRADVLPAAQKCRTKRRTSRPSSMR
jgi:hypothetical protein